MIGAELLSLLHLGLKWELRKVRKLTKSYRRSAVHISNAFNVLRHAQPLQDLQQSGEDSHLL